MDFSFDRKIEVNSWIIKLRWFYVGGVLLIGFLTKIISESNISFSYSLMVLIAVAFIVINLFFYLGLRKIKKTKSSLSLTILGGFGIGAELVTFIYIMHLAGGIESISPVFFFMPIVSSSLIFGARGSIITALISALLINFLVVFEYLGIIPHIFRYGVDTSEFKSLPISLTKTVTISIFYLIIGWLSGYGAKLLFRREYLLRERSEKLNEGARLRQKELFRLDRAAKLLVRRDLELTEINNELNEKIGELEDSEKSLAKAFNELKKAKKKSEEEKNKTLAIISNIYAPIIVVDKNNRITLFNSAAQKFLGSKSSDLGKKISGEDNFNLNNFKSVIRNKFILSESKNNGSSDLKTEKLRVSCNNEELVYKVITSKVRGENNEYLGVMKIFLDLTRETAIDKLKSEFVSIAAHQLRTPLSAIKWVIKMVLDGDAGKLNNEQLELLTKGYKSNERIIRLVDDLLDISRIEEGRFGYNFKYSDFQEVLNNVVENAARLIAKNYLKLSVDKPKKLPEVYMDPARIVLVLQNLLDNAIKYTPEFGQIKIEVKVLDKGKVLKVSIKDQGVGIPKADQPKLFSKFFRAANAVRIETEGTGLGLFIAKNIIKKHQGEIGINSEEGKGTEAYFTLPISDITNQEIY